MKSIKAIYRAVRVAVMSFREVYCIEMKSFQPKNYLLIAHKMKAPLRVEINGQQLVGTA
jgi:hypothetical protein